MNNNIVINEGKQYKIKTSLGEFGRHAIKTHFIKIGEDYLDLIKKYVCPNAYGNDIVAISSKIISLCQKNVIYKSDMKVSLLARFLSKFASKSNAGIGVNNVYKMQYAIDTCGKMKVFYAALVHGFYKIFFKKKGVFYDIIGKHVSGLDGFYDKSFKEYGEFGICLPKDPDSVCNDIYNKTGLRCIIVDENDFSCNILGKSDSLRLDDSIIKEILRDNPFGQSNQCTPFILFRKLYENIITLERFLMLFSGEPDEASVFSLVNTNNSSFPEEYRYKHEHPASLWMRLWKKRDPILRRYIKRIIVMPKDTDIDKLTNDYEYDIYIDIDKGSYFCTSTGKTILPVIHIILDEEESIV